MLHDCNLHNIYTGGISSYFLVLLIVSYLQVYGHTSKNLGGHLLNLLDLYGNKFNFAATQISVIEPGSHLIIPPQQNFSHHHTDLSPPHTPSVPPLNVVDPLNPSQIVGQSVFGMWQVQLAFRNAYAVLHMHYLEEGIPEHPTAIDQLLASILSSPM
jgi:non-canonical poly(A) RNA polymerase PAPD5/7